MFVDFERRILALLLCNNYFVFKTTIMEETKNPSGTDLVSRNELYIHYIVFFQKKTDIIPTS